MFITKGAKVSKNVQGASNSASSIPRTHKIKEATFQNLVAWGPSTRGLCTPVYYYTDSILRGTIFMTGTILARVKTAVAQKATVHKGIALNEGTVISLAFLE
jgi:hypothetical protein